MNCSSLISVIDSVFAYAISGDLPAMLAATTSLKPSTLPISSSPAKSASWVLDGLGAALTNVPTKQLLMIFQRLKIRVRTEGHTDSGPPNPGQVVRIFRPVPIWVSFCQYSDFNRLRIQFIFDRVDLSIDPSDMHIYDMHICNMWHKYINSHLKTFGRIQARCPS